MDEQMPVVLYSIRRFSSFTLSSASSEPHTAQNPVLQRLFDGRNTASSRH
jgi:hypothetical protein